MRIFGGFRWVPGRLPAARLPGARIPGGAVGFIVFRVGVGRLAFARAAIRIFNLIRLCAVKHLRLGGHLFQRTATRAADRPARHFFGDLDARRTAAAGKAEGHYPFLSEPRPQGVQK